jgi:carboxyl-terminal processing protease
MKLNIKNKALFYIAVFLLFFGCMKKSESLDSTQIDGIISAMLYSHVTQNQFTDTISERTLNNLIKFTDPFKLYFLQSDIDTFMKDKNNINDFVNEKNYEFLDQFFSVYLKRAKQRISLVEKLIKTKHDFTVNESMVTDSDSISFATSDKEIEDRWRKRVKFQLLNYLQSDIKLDEAQKKLAKRYQLTKKEFENYDKSQQNSLFLKAFGSALDPHTSYLTKQEKDDFDISMGLNLQGIGAILRSEDGFVYVDSIIPGGPASKLPKSGELKPNDKIIAVAQGDNAPEEVIDMPLRDAVDKIRGKKGTTVKLTVLRKNPNSTKENRLIIPIVRDQVILEQQAAKYTLHTVKSGEKEHKVGFIRLPSFYRDFEAAQKNDPDARMASRDVLNAIKELKKQNADAIILDLRNNGGGALIESIKIAGYFISFGPVLMVKTQDNVQTHYDYDPSVQWNGPLTVLVNSASASASEIFAGAIRDYKRGLLIGPTKTFGKGSVQNMIDFKQDMGAMKVTIQLFYQPAGTSNNKTGITPHLIIPSYSNLNEYHEDELDYALDWEPITKSNYIDFGDKYLKDSIISTLQKNSDNRRKNDSDFTELSKLLKESSNEDEKSVSLKIDDTSDESASDSSIKEIDEDKIIDLENDIFLREAFTITGEYIEALKVQ